MRTAHQNGNEISCVKVSLDNNMMASCAGDDTLKLWDLRKFPSRWQPSMNLKPPST